MSSDQNSDITTIASTSIATTTAAPAQPTFWDNLTSVVIPTICWCVTVILIGILLYCYRYQPHLLKIRSKGLSTPMQYLLVNHIVNNAVFIISQHIIVNLVNINRPVFNWNGWLNPWFSFWVGNYLMAGPCTVFFVAMDRFLALTLNYKYTPEVQKKLKILEAVVMSLLYAFSVFNVLIAWPYADYCNEPGTEENPIANRPCLPLLNKIVNFTQQTIKSSFASVNFIISILFLYQLFKVKIKNLSDGVVKVTIICEFLFDFIPAFLSLFFSGAQITVSLNVYLFLMASLDAAICSLEYFRLLFNFKIFSQGRDVMIVRPSQMSQLTVSAVKVSSRSM
ncbi:hypothetical protein DdX_12966 [Ditylenchus destructor]|uniref:Uncharacterized protein n=1 Tax=Ditylenchus destructor TaxID=166010 RepID=A0AAD4MWU9_9BILA|nr:hypothetical protein DdX_12966 [Ditylenchus destructor]